MALNAQQVAAAGYLGGFTDPKILGEAVAVAYAESSWNPKASNSCCHGLWQINTQAHPSMSTNVYDPVQNARYAHAIYSQAGGWCTSGKPPNCNPWQGYGNSRYKEKLVESTSAAMLVVSAIHSGKSPQDLLGMKYDVSTWNPASDIASGLTGGAITNPIAPIITAVNRMGKWVTNPDNLARILKVVMGGAVIVVGAAIILEKPVGTVVSNVLPAGKAIKKVSGK